MLTGNLVASTFVLIALVLGLSLVCAGGWLLLDCWAERKPAASRGSVSRLYLRAKLTARKYVLQHVFGMGGVGPESMAAHAMALLNQVASVGLAWFNFLRNLNAGAVPWERSLARGLMIFATAIDASSIVGRVVLLALAWCGKECLGAFSRSYENAMLLALVSSYCRVLLAWIDIQMLFREEGFGAPADGYMRLYLTSVGFGFLLSLVQVFQGLLELHTVAATHHNLRYRRTKLALKVNEANPLSRLLWAQWASMFLACFWALGLMSYLFYGLGFGDIVFGCCEPRTCYVGHHAEPAAVDCTAPVLNCSSVFSPLDCGPRWAVSTFRGGLSSRGQSTGACTACWSAGGRSDGLHVVESLFTERPCQCELLDHRPPQSGADWRQLDNHTCRVSGWSGFEERAPCNVLHSELLDHSESFAFVLFLLLSFACGCLPIAICYRLISSVGVPSTAQRRALLPASAFSPEQDVLGDETAIELPMDAASARNGTPVLQGSAAARPTPLPAGNGSMFQSAKKHEGPQVFLLAGEACGTATPSSEATGSSI